MQRLVNLNNFIIEKGLNNKNFNEKIEDTEKKIAESEKLISKLKDENKILVDLKEKANIYYGGKTLNQAKISFAKEMLDEYKITEYNVSNLLRVVDESNNEIKTLSSELETMRDELLKLGEPREFYGEVNGGTFVQRLVKEEQQWRRTELRQRGIKI